MIAYEPKLSNCTFFQFVKKSKALSGLVTNHYMTLYHPNRSPNVLPECLKYLHCFQTPAELDREEAVPWGTLLSLLLSELPVNLSRLHSSILCCSQNVSKQ